MPARVLIVAGLEPEGRAGLLADVEAVAACGAQPVGCASAIAAQPPSGAAEVEPVSVRALSAQIEAAFAHGPIAAVKLGMLARPELAELVRAQLAGRPPVPLVIDPVLATSTGAPLFSGGSYEATYRELCRLRPVLTPNVPELAILSGRPALDDASDESRGAEVLLGWGARAVLVKGGHRDGPAVDLLFEPEGRTHRFEAPRLSSDARGKGCRLASALAAFLAQGEPLEHAVDRARARVRRHLARFAPAAER